MSVSCCASVAAKRFSAQKAFSEAWLERIVWLIHEQSAFRCTSANVLVCLIPAEFDDPSDLVL